MKAVMKLFAALILMILFVACDGKNVVGGPPGTYTTLHINFTNLQVGMSSRFVRFTGTSYSSPAESKYTFVADTLIVSIVAKEGESFTVEEKLSPGSVSRQGGRLGNPDDIYRYSISLAGKAVTFTSDKPYVYSFLVHSWQQLDLDRQSYTAPPNEFLPRCEQSMECSYYSEKIEQRSQSLYNVNFVIDNSPMAYDGVGTTIIYSKNAGIIRVVYANPWQNTVEGWDLLP